MSKSKRKGMYLKLFHGRPTTTEDMDDWGTEGPDIGPLHYAHTTYASEIKLMFERLEDAKSFGFDDVEGISLDIVNDLVEYQGVYYGDWSCHIV